MYKRKTLIIISVIIVVVAVTLLCLFMPRSVSKHLSFDDVVKVECLYPFDDEVIFELTEDEISQLEIHLDEVKYRKTFQKAKTYGNHRYLIYYKDGSKILLEDFRYNKYNASGAVEKTILWKTSLPDFE